MKLVQPICLAFVVLNVAVAGSTRADVLAYNGKVTLATTNGEFIATHFHDWSSPKLEQMTDDDALYFSATNTLSGVAVTDLRTRREIFASPCPALTYIWLSPDNRFLVGLSNVKRRNPYQLVIWDLQKRSVIWREHISSEVAVLTKAEFRYFCTRYSSAGTYLLPRARVLGDEVIIDYQVPGDIGYGAWSYLYNRKRTHPYSQHFGESVTNWVFWYHEKPELRIEFGTDELTLSLLDPDRKRFSVRIPSNPVDHVLPSDAARKESR